MKGEKSGRSDKAVAALFLAAILGLSVLGVSLSSENASAAVPNPETIKAIGSWTVMVYLDGDNNLDTYGDADLSELQTAGTVAGVSVIVLKDDSVSGDSTFWVGSDGGAISQVTTGLPTWWPSTDELDMGDVNLLINFIEWCMANYPAEHYWLDMWNHGGSLSGECWDDTDGTNIDLLDLRTALETVHRDTGDWIDVLSHDECLMAENGVNYNQMRFVNYTVSSEDSIGGDGFEYQNVMPHINNNPSISPADFALAICDEYYLFYGTSGTYTTLSAINNTLYQYYMVEALNAFGQKLMHGAGTYNTQITTARDNAASWQATAGYDFDSDMVDFCYQIQSQIPSTTDAEIYNAAERLINISDPDADGAGVIMMHNQNLGEYGIKSYVEDGTTYRTDYDNSMISVETNWDDFVKAMLASTDYPNEEPVIEMLTPVAGEKIYTQDNISTIPQVTVSGIVRISGTATDPDGTVSRVEICIDRDWWNTTAVTLNADGTWYYDWNTSLVPEGPHHVMVRAYDGQDWSEYYEHAWLDVVHNRPPTVSLLYPAGGEITSGIIDIQWNATDPDGDQLSIDLYYSSDGGNTWNTIATGEVNDGSYLWDTSIMADGVNYLIRINATDTAPQTATAESDPFSIDNVPDDQWFLQVQTPGIAGYQNLSMEPVELAGNSVATDINDAGQFLIGSTGWMTHSFADGKSLNGNWTFNVWGKVTDGTAISGYLYAKIYKYDGVSQTLLYTTVDDDEDVGLYETPHLFTWTDTVTGTISAGDAISVEIWLDALSGATSSFISDYAESESGIYGSQSGDYLNTTVSDNVYEGLTEDNATSSVTLLFEDFEGGTLPTGWSHAAWDYTNSPPFTIDEWGVGTPSGTGAPAPYSGSYCAAVNISGDYSSSQGAYLESPPITIPTGATGANLSFWLYSDMENTYDGMNLKVSVNGGAYQNVSTSVAYDDTALSTGYSNPIGGEAAWCGVASWRNPVFDIFTVAGPGDTVQFRWHFGSDTSITNWGPAVDDVLVTADIPTSMLEHIWTFNVTGGGTAVTFAVEAYHTANTEGDDFAFYYSTDNVTYTPMLNITKTADDDLEQTYSLPSTLTGTAYIKAVDIDRTAGNTYADTLYIDKMVIRTSVGAPQFVLYYDYGDTQSNVIPALSAPAAPMDINLVAGWNLISIPWLTTPTEIGAALSGINWTRAMVCENEVWKTYGTARLAKYNLGFPLVDNTMGIWVYVSTDSVLSGPGDSIGSTDILLHKGWNLVGYPSGNGTKTVADALLGIPYDYVQTYNTTTGQMDILASTDIMEPGKGYWIHTTAAAIWTVYW